MNGNPAKPRIKMPDVVMDIQISSKKSVDEVIDDLYNQIVVLHFDHMKFRLQADSVNAEKTQLKRGILQEEMNALIDHETKYQKFQKLKGRKSGGLDNNSKKAISEYGSSVGSIVASIPKANNKE